MPLAYLGGRMTDRSVLVFFLDMKTGEHDFFSYGMYENFDVILLSNSRGRRGRGLR